MDVPSTSSIPSDILYFDDGQYGNDSTQSPMDSPYVRFAGAVAALIYILTFVVGIPANLYVLFRMRRLASSDNERYRNGTGIALCSMAAADLCSILLICAQNVHQMTYYDRDVDHSTSLTAHALCKGMLFMTHTVTSISIWSWLLLSCLRYLAICHPLYHLRLWRMPYRALAFIISMSAVLNMWLLVAMESSPEGCVQTVLLKRSLAANRLFQIVEAVWSFCIPCAVIIIMDSSVVLKSTSFPRLRLKVVRRKASALEEVVKLTRTSSDKMKRRHQKALFKWLVVALICILLNTPENMYRLVILLSLGGESSIHEDAISLACRTLAQALYFSQFAFNAIYLAIFVYDKSCRSKGGAQNYETSIFNSHAVQLCRSRRTSHVGEAFTPKGSLTGPHGALKSNGFQLVASAPRILMPSTSLQLNMNGGQSPPSLSLPTTPRQPLLLKVFPKETKISSPPHENGSMSVTTGVL